MMTVGQIAGARTYSKKCHALFERTLGVQKALVTTSCTHALEICSLLLDIQAGDEVIVPAFAFVSTANAFVLRGAQIVFAEVRPDTFNLDETRLEALITGRTKRWFSSITRGSDVKWTPLAPLVARTA
jgi:dTDP-4-amino-4,6-dideoxygalactose transaminase